MHAEHPAVSAWRQMNPSHATPERLEVYQQDTRSTIVYRLARIGPEHTNVIAKRSRRDTARIERTVYEEILPELPVPALHYYGCVPEPDGEFWWLFLEDASGDAEYLPHLEEHRVPAARWLGIMNIFASGLEAAAHLPRRTPQHYLKLLHSARQVISSSLANPSLKTNDLALLEGILVQCDRLRARWNELVSACEGVPQTLVHGDFIKKNVRVRCGRDGMAILPFDWEKAGWGIPAEDISRVHLPTYWSTIKDHWPGLDIQALQRLASVGKVFRCLVFLDWIAPGLAFQSVEQPIKDLRRCQAWLADLIQATGWQD
jgi:hypothetical protein